MTHPGGRPLKYKTPEALQAAVDNYFTECDNRIVVKQHAHSKGITEVKTPTPYTIAGLARALNVDRDTINNYSKRDEFFGIISHARDKIQESNLTLGLLGCHDSKLAALNLASNYGYSTKESIEHSGPGGGPIEYTDTERAARLAAILSAVKGRKAAEGE